MDWTITRRVVAKGDVDATVEVTATKGETTLTRKFDRITTEEQLKNEVRRWLQGYESANALSETGSLDITPDTPTRTQAEIERDEWYQDLGNLRFAQELITLGVLTGTETPVVNLRNKVKTNFKAGYIV
jgi:hypothetical protein